MLLSRALGSGLAIVLCVGLVACAEGSAISDPAGGNGSGGGGIGGAGLGGRGGSESSSSKPSSSPSGPSAQASSSASGEGGRGEGGRGDGGSGDGGATSTSSMSSSASSSSSGVVCDFTSPNQCSTAEGLGAIAGDEDGAPITLTGNTSKWYAIKIEERDSSIGGEDLSWRVTLASPVGMNYDLIVHEGPQDGGVDCAGTLYPGVAGGAGEVAEHGYDDDQGFGGESDTLWIAIEVRYVSGEACSLSDTWSLTIQGHL